MSSAEEPPDVADMDTAILVARVFGALILRTYPPSDVTRVKVLVLI
jgi:hypothetical protein